MSTWQKFLAGGSFFIVDQLTKWCVVRQGIEWQATFVTIKAFVNPHALFSLPVSTILSILASLLVLALIVYALCTARDARIAWAMVLIVAGGSSNLVDRLLQGGVIDIIRVHTMLLNLADLYIVAGCLLATVAVWREDTK